MPHLSSLSLAIRILIGLLQTASLLRVQIGRLMNCRWVDRTPAFACVEVNCETWSSSTVFRQTGKMCFSAKLSVLFVRFWGPSGKADSCSTSQGVILPRPPSFEVFGPLSSAVSYSRRFEGTCPFHLQGSGSSRRRSSEIPRPCSKILPPCMESEVSGGAVGWGTTLQTGRSRVRFPMVSLEFVIQIILPAAQWLWGCLSL